MASYVGTSGGAGNDDTLQPYILIQICFHSTDEGLVVMSAMSGGGAEREGRYSRGNLTGSRRACL